MNLFFLAASVLTVILGVGHSILGERLIFIPLRMQKPSGGSRAVLRNGPLGIIWATWHLTTALGFGLAGVFWLMALKSPPTSQEKYYGLTISAGLLVSSFLVGYATRCRHPGWIVLAVIALLTIAGSLAGVTT